MLWHSGTIFIMWGSHGKVPDCGVSANLKKMWLYMWDFFPLKVCEMPYMTHTIQRAQSCFEHAYGHRYILIHFVNDINIHELNANSIANSSLSWNRVSPHYCESPFLNSSHSYLATKLQISVKIFAYSSFCKIIK